MFLAEHIELSLDLVALVAQLRSLLLHLRETFSELATQLSILVSYGGHMLREVLHGTGKFGVDQLRVIILRDRERITALLSCHIPLSRAIVAVLVSSIVSYLPESLLWLLQDYATVIIW